MSVTMDRAFAPLPMVFIMTMRMLMFQGFHVNGRAPAAFHFCRQPHSHCSKNRRIASIEASRILSWPPSHLSTVERDTPSSREIRAFFHFDRSAKARKRAKASALWRSLHSFGVVGCVAIDRIIFQVSNVLIESASPLAPVNYSVRSRS
jgi:hypothetical protein